MATPTNLPSAAVAGQILTAQYMNDLRGSFRVLQVVQATTATVATNSTATYADTGLTATITPQATSNKILVLVSQAGCSKSAGSAFNALALQLVRASTGIQTFAQYSGYTGGADARYLNIGNQATVFLDSPNSVAAVTYKTQFRNIGIGAAEVKVQDNIGGAVNTSTITLVEISA